MSQGAHDNKVNAFLCLICVLADHIIYEALAEGSR